MLITCHIKKFPPAREPKIMKITTETAKAKTTALT